MIERGITRRYVRALFSLAVEEKVEDRVHQDLVFLQQVMEENPDLMSFLRDPRTSGTVKKQALEKVLPEGLQELTGNFILLLAERGRAVLLQDALAEYVQLLKAHQGIVLVQLTTAAALDQKNEDGLKEALARVTGKEIELEVEEDPALLAGLRLRIGSTLYDGSLRRELEDLRGSLGRVTLPAPEPLALSLDDSTPASETDSPDDGTSN